MEKQFSGNFLHGIIYLLCYSFKKGVTSAIFYFIITGKHCYNQQTIFTGILSKNANFSILLAICPTPMAQ